MYHFSRLTGMPACRPHPLPPLTQLPHLPTAAPPFHPTPLLPRRQGHHRAHISCIAGTFLTDAPLPCAHLSWTPALPPAPCEWPPPVPRLRHAARSAPAAWSAPAPAPAVRPAQRCKYGQQGLERPHSLQLARSKAAPSVPSQQHSTRQQPMENSRAQSTHTHLLPAWLRPRHAGKCIVRRLLRGAARLLQLPHSCRCLRGRQCTGRCRSHDRCCCPCSPRCGGHTRAARGCCCGRRGRACCGRGRHRGCGLGIDLCEALAKLLYALVPLALRPSRMGPHVRWQSARR